MSDLTPRFSLPLLVSGQAQKDITHNEALLAIDIAVNAVVLDVALAVAPADPAEGQCWLVPPGASGDWEANGDKVAAWTAGGWRFVDLPVGAALFVVSTGKMMRRAGAGWSVDRWSGDVAPALAGPAGGAIIDAEARGVLTALIARLQLLGLVAA